MTAHATIEGGFADPVLASQSTFRAVMQAMARPGTVATAADAVSPPLPFNAAAGALACTLADADTPVWLDAAAAESGALVEWLTFHTGAAFAAAPAAAAFAFVMGAKTMPPLNSFNQGTQDYPDRSTTIVLQVEGLEGGPVLTLAGPGIKSVQAIAPRGLPADFAAQWAENRARFPRGVDLVLAAGARFLCLPRSSRLVAAEG